MGLKLSAPISRSAILARAESWKVVDSTSWEFKLRQGVKWHDGAPFSAQDVKISIDRIKDPKLKSTAAPFVAISSAASAVIARGS
jgi:peptide/nickel transport system substrate-binding protein